MSAADYVVVDLDGTLLDIRARHHAAHTEAAQAAGVAPLAPRLYWRRRRAGPGPVLRSVTSRQAATYASAFAAAIERDDLLRLDGPLPGALRWFARHEPSSACMVVVTARRRPAAAAQQLERLQLPHELLVVTGAGNKAEAVRKRFDPSRVVVWIGDTEADIEAARELKVRALAVCSGLRSAAFLRRRDPDGLYASVTRIPLSVVTPAR